MLKENLEFESLTYKTLGNTKERKEHFFKFVENFFNIELTNTFLFFITFKFCLTAKLIC